MRGIITAVVLLGVTAFSVLPGQDPATGPRYERPAEAVELVDLVLDQGWVVGKIRKKGLQQEQLRPIAFRLFKRGERFTTGWAIIGDSNKPHTLETSGLRCRNGAITGDVIRWRIGNARAWEAEVWTLTATLQGDRISGTFTCKRPHDPTAPDKGGIDLEGPLSGQLLAGDALEQLAQGNTLADGAAWPACTGPYANGRAVDAGVALVQNLEDAKLAWRAEAQLIPGSPGQGHPWSGGTRYDYDGPIVADGKVFFFLMEPDLTGPVIEMPQRARIEAQPMGKRLYPWIASFLVDDVGYCFDARTGALLWRTVIPRRGANGNLVFKGKGGHWSTPVHADGKVYWCGSNSWVYCLDAADGSLVWQRALQPELVALFDEEVAKALPAPKGEGRKLPLGAFHNHLQTSPCLAAGVLVAPVRGLSRKFPSGLYGVDAASGEVLWGPIPSVGRYGSPVCWRHEGREYVLTPDVRCIDPKTGKVLWSWEAPKGQRWFGAIQDGLYLPRYGGLVGAEAGPILRLSPQGAELHATIPDLKSAGRVSHRHAKMGSTCDGAGHFFYLHYDGLYAVDGDGELVAHCPGEFIGKRTGYGNLLYGDGRIIAPGNAGGLYMWSWDKQAKTLTCPGNYDINNYWCHVPAMADGRLFVRLNDGIVCFDLRK